MRGVVAVFALLAGCADPELEHRLQELEERVAELEGRGTPATPATPATPVPPGLPPMASAERENEAGAVLRQAAEAIEQLEWDTARTHLAKLRESYPDTRAAKASTRLVSELEIVGKPEAELKVDRWLSGSESDLASGKATLYVFWEAWCSHCQRDIPKMAQLYDRHRAKGLRVLGVTRMSKGVTDEQVDTFLKDLDVRYPNVKDSGDTLTRHYGVTGIPAAAIVQDGKVVWRGAPHRIDDELLKRFL